MRRVITAIALGSTLALFACSDALLNPATPTSETQDQPTSDAEQPPTNEPSAPGNLSPFNVWGMRWITSDLPAHWVYYWSGGAARQLTVSLIAERGGVTQGVVWEIVDISGRGICAHARVVDGVCPGGALMHGEVPVGAQATVKVDTPNEPTGWYRLSITLMDGRVGSFEFTS